MTRSASPTMPRTTALEDRTFQQDTDYPTNSRLFVLCDKSSSEKAIIAHFAPYGTVEYCKIIRDKPTNASKGYCYVKFDKASSAADAMEQADATRIGHSQFPIRIQIAESKGVKQPPAGPSQFSTEPEDSPPRSRLFVVIPRELTEENLFACFSSFEDFDYCKIICDKQTGESKGFAYVKFFRASSAAFALESINEKGEIDNYRVKVLVADPKVKTHTSSPPDVDDNSHFLPTAPFPHYGYGYAPMMHPYYFPMMPPMMEVHFTVECSSKLGHEDIVSLFAPFAGFEQISNFQLSQSQAGQTRSLAQVYFTDPQRAMIAVEALNGTTQKGEPFSCRWRDSLQQQQHPMYFPMMVRPTSLLESNSNLFQMPPFSYGPPLNDGNS